MKAFLSFFLLLFSSPAVAAPFLREALPDQPKGLWITTVLMETPAYREQEVSYYRFRVYCPTMMMRDITDGKWGQAKKAREMTSYPRGVIEEATSVC